MPKVKIRYSAQAQKLIDQLKDFDREKLEKWFYGDDSMYMAIGDGQILDYIYNIKKNGN